MPAIEVADVEGNTVRCYEFRNKYFPDFPHLNMDEVLSCLPTLPGREDDVMILAYPKSGTNWLWEVINMLVSGKGEVEHQNRIKDESFIEAQPAEYIDKLPSVRLLNTHVTPEFYPTDLVNNKTKIIYILRNPKDVFVSYFHHTKKLKLYDYQGSWNGYFNLIMDGKTDYGRWFEFTKSWDKFFRGHPDIPVLTVYYEDMKKDLSGGVQRMARFLELPCDTVLLKNIVKSSTFENMKKERPKLPEEMVDMVVGDSNPMFRKGIIGDWKNHFTVAQNERFDAEYKNKMEGLSFDFEQYM